MARVARESVPARFAFWIATSAPARARRFYAQVFGARLVRRGRRFYVRAAVRPGEVSAIRRVVVDDVEKYVAAVIAAGGRRVLAPMRVGPGFIAWCQDPDGNVLRLESAHGRRW